MLYVGKATDLQARVRSYFTSDRRRKVGRLLRQLHAVHHRVCAGPLTAAVTEGRLIRAWSPPFNQQGTVRRRPLPGRPAGATGPGPGPGGDAGGHGPPRSWPRIRPSCWPRWPPRCASWPTSSATRRPGSSGTRSNGCCRLLDRHRRVTSLREAGRVVLAVEGEGEVVLDRGRVGRR